MIIILELIALAYIVYVCADGFLKKTGWTDPDDRKKIITAATISGFCQNDQEKK